MNCIQLKEKKTKILDNTTNCSIKHKRVSEKRKMIGNLQYNESTKCKSMKINNKKIHILFSKYG